MVVNEGDTVVLDCQPFVDFQRFIEGRSVLFLWRLNGAIVDGQRSVTFTIDRADTSLEGTYQCVARGPRNKGTVTEFQDRRLVVRGLFTSNAYKCPMTSHLSECAHFVAKLHTEYLYKSVVIILFILILYRTIATSTLKIYEFKKWK